MLKPTMKFPAVYIALFIFIIALAVGVNAFFAWLLGIILTWFGVTLEFWKCFVIVFFVGCLTGGSRASS
jgi:hypothetical protein